MVTYFEMPAAAAGAIPGTLGYVRRKLVEHAGRFDLVTDAEGGDYSDNGANHLINAAQRWLDRQLPYHKSDAWLYKLLTAGDSLVTFQQARFVKAVYLATDGDGRSELDKVSLEWMLEQYTDVPLSSIDNAAPLYWSPAPIGLAPEQKDETSSTFLAAGLTDYDHIAFGDHHPYNGIYVMPPCDADRTLRIHATWYSQDLTADGDKSFWTARHPDLLERATRLQIETDLHRNSEGQRDFRVSLQEDVQDIYFDLVEEETYMPAEDMVMKG